MGEGVFRLQLYSAFEQKKSGFHISHTHITGEILAYSRIFCLQGTETVLNKLKPHREMSDLESRTLQSQGQQGRSWGKEGRRLDENWRTVSCCSLPSWPEGPSSLPLSGHPPHVPLSMEQCPLLLNVQAGAGCPAHSTLAWAIERASLNII